MTSNDAERIQQLSSGMDGLAFLSRELLKAIAVLCGDEARGEIERIRGSLLDQFKNSEVPAEREMEHAKIVGPALTAINVVVDSVLRDIPKKDAD